MKRLHEVSAGACFRDPTVPYLGLSEDPSLPLRVYVLKCEGDCYYVGISPQEKILTRLSEQHDASSEFCSDYCRKNRVIGVLCVWPAASEAIEAAVFFAMLRSLAGSDWSKLGGWTQTSSKVSPLVAMHLTQAKRQLTNRCFDCGGSHHAGHRSCPGSNVNCWYKCVKCMALNNVSSRGQSTLEGASAKAAAQSEPPQRHAVAAKASPHPAPRVSPVAPLAVPQISVEPSPVDAVLKRPAGQAFQRQTPACSEDESWQRCRKKGRYGCVRDVLKAMDTVQAGKSIVHINENAPRWQTRFKWKAGEYKVGIADFSAHQSGGKKGVGCTREAMADVYKHHAR